MRITKAYIVYGKDGEEIALLKAKDMYQAERIVRDRFGKSAPVWKLPVGYPMPEYFISQTEVDADTETFGWKR